MFNLDFMLWKQSHESQPWPDNKSFRRYDITYEDFLRIAEQKAKTFGTYKINLVIFENRINYEMLNEHLEHILENFKVRER